MWRVSGASVSYLNEAARNLQLKYSAVLSGTSERKPRWEECTDLVSGRYVPYTFIINTAKKKINKNYRNFADWLFMARAKKKVYVLCELFPLMIFFLALILV